MPHEIRIEEWRPDRAEAPAVDRDLEMLAEVLQAAVYGGAGVSFFVPFSQGEARVLAREGVARSARPNAPRGRRAVGDADCGDGAGRLRHAAQST